MKTKNICISYSEFKSPEELESVDRELVQEARKASEKAYAPYSKFNVGAAARLDNGHIVTGSNIENAAFPSGICAEHTAIASAVSGYPEQNIVALAIAARTESGFTEEPVPPCGKCRQIIAEEEFRSGRDIRIILSGKSGIFVIDKGGDLLPFQFNSDTFRSALP